MYWDKSGTKRLDSCIQCCEGTWRRLVRGRRAVMAPKAGLHTGSDGSVLCAIHASEQLSRRVLPSAVTLSGTAWSRLRRPSASWPASAGWATTTANPLQTRLHVQSARLGLPARPSEPLQPPSKSRPDGTAPHLTAPICAAAPTPPTKSPAASEASATRGRASRAQLPGSTCSPV